VKSFNVLLIEDSPSYVLLLRSMLAEVKGDAFEFACVESLAEGRQKLAGGGVDVVLLDLTLPDSRGLDTFANIRAAAGGIPIVVLTSLDDETIALKALQDGASDYLVKSEVNGNWVARSLRYAIERNRAVKPPEPDKETAQQCLDVEIVLSVAVVRFLEKRIISLSTIDAMKNQLYGLVDQARHQNMLLNFSNVEYISNAAIGILVGLHKKATSSGDRLILCHVSPEVLEHFSARRLNKVFDIQAEEESALKAFG
jgi:anti-anti-sigma factor